MSFQPINRRKSKTRTERADQYDVPASSPPPSSKRKRIVDGLQVGKTSKKQRSADTEHDPTDHDDQVETPTPNTPGKESSPAGSERSGRRLSNGVRGPRKGRNATVGFFTAEEVQMIEKFKVDFCNLNGLGPKEFDRLVQHSARSSDHQWPLSVDACSKKHFWDQIYELAPGRDKRSLYRFMRRHFQDSGQKAHDWTAEQDEELIDLISQMPGKYAEIAGLLGRSDDDVVQRWKNRLEHRNSMNTGHWTEHELTELLDEIAGFFAAYKKENPDSGCKDLYGMPDGVVSWTAVSKSMGNARTRQQCADKWRKIRNRVQEDRAEGNPNAVYDVTAEAMKPRRKGARNAPKSSYLVEEDDDDDDTNVPEVPNGTTNEPQDGSITAKLGNGRASTPPTSVENNTKLQESPEDSKRGILDVEESEEAVPDAAPSSPAITQNLDEEAEENPTVGIKASQQSVSEVAPSSPVGSQDPENKSKSKAEKKAEKEERRRRKAERREKRQSKSEHSNDQVPQVDTPSKATKQSSQSAKKKKSKIFPW